MTGLAVVYAGQDDVIGITAPVQGQVWVGTGVGGT
jgi:hypothetical protein